MVILSLHCRCLPSVNTICGCIMIGLSLLSSVSKHNMRHIMIGLSFSSSVNTICGGIMIGLSLSSFRKHIYNMIGLSLSSDSKHNKWSYYDWVYCCCRPSVNTICGRIMIGLSSVSKHNMWSYYDWVVVRQ